MKYLILCCFNEERWKALPEAETDAVMEEYGAWMEDVERAGQHLASAKLQPSASAATIRSNGGRPTITDGPFAETKEQLGGYHLIECSSFDEAVSIALRIPTLPVGGTIEVREVESAH